jgi:hypothetical protein
LPLALDVAPDEHQGEEQLENDHDYAGRSRKVGDAVWTTLLAVAGILIGVLTAIAVPIAIERRRRPALSIDVGEPTTTSSPPAVRFVHLVVRNEPIKAEHSSWWLRRVDTWLIRTVATGCKVSLTFEELGSDKRPVENMLARWSGAPEPVSPYVDPETGETRLLFDVTKTPQGRSFELSPDDEGETLAIAIKHNGSTSAYAFNSNSYQPENKPLWCFATYELTGEEYRIYATAKSGGIVVDRTFRLHNYGHGLDDFRLAPEPQ